MISMPIFAQEYNSTEKINELENQLGQLTIELRDTQSHNMDLETHIGELENKIINLEDHGINFGINETKLGESLGDTINQQEWTEGDVLVGSTTIFAFFTFSSLLVIRFQSTFRKQLVEITKDILLATGAIQFLQIMVIGSIVWDIFDEESYTAILFATMIMLIIILVNTYRIIKTENTIDQRKEEGLNISRELKSEITASGVDNTEIINRLNAVERENKRIRQELGE